MIQRRLLENCNDYLVTLLSACILIVLFRMNSEVDEAEAKCRLRTHYFVYRWKFSRHATTFNDCTKKCKKKKIVMKLRRALGIKAFKHAAYYSTVCHFAEFSCYCDDVDSSNYFLCFFFKNAHVS